MGHRMGSEEGKQATKVDFVAHVILVHEFATDATYIHIHVYVFNEGMPTSSLSGPYPSRDNMPG